MKPKTKNTSRTKAKRDKYDLAIAYLTKNPQKIYEAWNTATMPRFHRERGWELFQPCGGRDCGCLTQVKYWHGEAAATAATPALTRRIRRLKWVPVPEEIGVQHLAKFAAIQREIDSKGLRNRGPE